MTKITLEIDTDKPKDIEQAYNLLDSINQIEEADETPQFEQDQQSIAQHPTMQPIMQQQQQPLYDQQMQGMNMPLGQQVQQYQQQQIQNQQQQIKPQFQPNMNKSMPAKEISVPIPDMPLEDEEF